jgi:hypothetical protein
MVAVGPLDLDNIVVLLIILQILWCCHVGQQ